MCTYIFFSVHIYIYLFLIYRLFFREKTIFPLERSIVHCKANWKKKETLDCGGSCINLLKFRSHLSANWPLVGPQEHVGEYQTQKNVSLACFMKIRSCNFFQKVAWKDNRVTPGTSLPFYYLNKHRSPPLWRKLRFLRPVFLADF